jgi:FkbM family methyltransferase
MTGIAASPLQGIFFHDFANAYIPHILKEIYMDKIYQPFLIGKRDLTIVDFGANIGLTAHFFKDYGTVYAVEPAQIHQESIQAMIKQNDIKNIIPCKYAISNVNGKTKFYHNDNSTMFSLLNAVNKSDDFEEVETVTVDTFMDREKIKHIDLLKMDLEGFESEVVSSEGFKKACPNIDVIIGEHHQWSMMGPNLFATTLTDLGYTFNWLRKTEASVFSAVRI